MDRYTMLAIVCSALAVAALVTPLSDETLKLLSQGERAEVLGLRLAHLGSFAIAFGTSVWVTFVAGVVLFRSLPRHQFGEVQSHLFPAYFRLEVAFASLALASFALLHPPLHSPPADKGQLWALALPAAGALLNLLLLEPITTKVMKERHRIEKEAGIGTEVGLSKNREVAKTNLELRAANKRFGMVHGFSSLANLVGLIGMAAHLYYIAASVQV